MRSCSSKREDGLKADDTFVVGILVCVRTVDDSFSSPSSSSSLSSSSFSSSDRSYSSVFVSVFLYEYEYEDFNVGGIDASGSDDEDTKLSKSPFGDDDDGLENDDNDAEVPGRNRSVGCRTAGDGDVEREEDGEASRLMRSISSGVGGL